MARPWPAAPTYQRRQPEHTVLYRTIEAHLDTFLAQTAGDTERSGVPAFVKREFEAYLRCGILSHGLVHLRCEACGDDMVVAFSCKGRGFCPSCGGRRMSELAAQLVDRVLPHVPVRQWVFTVPVPVRYQLAFDAALTRAVLRVFLRTVFGWLRRAATRQGIVGGRCGAVTAIQRFGGALNLNIHVHSLVLDGVYTRPSVSTPPRFHATPPPTDDDIARLLGLLQRRVRRLLVRRGRLPEDAEAPDPFAAQEPLFAGTVAASLQGRVALGPRAGQPVRRLRSAAAASKSPPRCARLDGFSLHADVALPAHRRDRLEHLCRYLLRPPLALERLTETSGGQLLYAFRRPWADGSIAMLLTPLELLERLAVLVPAPHVHLLTYHGVLAPHAAWRAAIVPAPVVGAPAAETGRADPERPRPPGRRSWAALLRRVFALEGLTCPRCGGPRRIVAAVTEPPALQRLLAALGLAAEPPPRPPVTVGPVP